MSISLTSVAGTTAHRNAAPLAEKSAWFTPPSEQCEGVKIEDGVGKQRDIFSPLVSSVAELAKQAAD